MLTWWPYCICWSCDYVSCDCEATDTGEDYWSEADSRFYKGARKWDEGVKQWFGENNWYEHDL